MAGKLLYRIAKAPFMGWLVGASFRYFGRILPVKRVYIDRDVIAFRHPRPAYDDHIILSPRRAIADLREMASVSGGAYFAGIWRAKEAIRRALPAYGGSFTLAANGGKRQEVGQVHFHMFTGHDMVSGRDGSGPDGTEVYRDASVRACLHPAPEWEFHCMVRPAGFFPADGNARSDYFAGVLRAVDALCAENEIVQRGYTLVCRCGADGGECPVFHIVAGRKK